jgi:hypothetical protein
MPLIAGKTYKLIIDIKIGEHFYNKQHLYFFLILHPILAAYIKKEVKKYMKYWFFISFSFCYTGLPNITPVFTVTRNTGYSQQLQTIINSTPFLQQYTTGTNYPLQLPYSLLRAV